MSYSLSVIVFRNSSSKSSDFFDTFLYSFLLLNKGFNVLELSSLITFPCTALTLSPVSSSSNAIVPSGVNKATLFKAVSNDLKDFVFHELAFAVN